MELLASKLTLISIMALPFLLAVTLHEAGHAYAASAFGDNTAKSQGRLSLNPLVHIDPLGTVVIPLSAVLLGVPFLIGYAKPVPVQPRYFKNYKRDMILVALAGPAGNLVVAILCAVALSLALKMGMSNNDWIVRTAEMGIFLNCLFMVFNLLPIPPLDGSAVVEQFLPHEMAQSYRSIAPFGFLILMGIIIVAKEIILVPSIYAAQFVAALVGVPF